MRRVSYAQHIKARQKKYYSDSRFRSSDLWVMSPTRYRCAKSLYVIVLSLLPTATVLAIHPRFFLTRRLLYVPAVISRPLRFMPLRVIWSVPSHGHDTHPSFAMGLCRRSQVPLSLIPCQPIHLAPGRRVIAPMRGLTHTYASICDVCQQCVPTGTNAGG